jgi:hypothetical protein
VSPLPGSASQRVPRKTSIPPAPNTAADIAALDPLKTLWPAHERFHRCYDVSWGSRDFYSSGPQHPGRFHPFTPAGRSGDLPVLYGAKDDIGALSETVFHDVPIRGTKHVPRSKLNHQLIIQLAPTRDLTLIDLTSDGLRWLNLSRVELIESDARSYAETAAWARALHDHSLKADGLMWVSRQHDLSQCLILFGDRVKVSELDIPADATPLPLGIGPGYDMVCHHADRAGITITNP